MSNTIHPTAVVGERIQLGTGNVIGPYCIFTGDVSVGDGNWFGAHCVVGAPAQFSTRKYEFGLLGDAGGGVQIGSRNVIREFTTVHQPSRDETIIENECYIMAYNHVSHDTVIHSLATLANNCQIGGFSEIGVGATLGLSTVVHQFATIGAYSMVGMGSVVGRDVPPFAKVAGDPLTFLGINTVGLDRNGFDDAFIERIRAHYGQDQLADLAEMEPLVAAFLKRNAMTGRRILKTTRVRSTV